MSAGDTVGAASELRAALLEHYDRRRRSLPWRGETDPYRVLVSEVMLQQTRVETVERYYGAWLDRFPDLATLAAADEGEVLKAWEGLGYYRRARWLHRAARVARERPDGSLPSSYAGLKGLPGVGDYTAGAVASIAHGERVPAVDGNVRRVLARLFDLLDPKPAALRETADRLVDPERPGDWNQALMELGATVCTPRSPRCGGCPVRPWCRAHDSGTVAARPGRGSRPSPRRATYLLVVLSDLTGRVLLRRRAVGGLLGGMWAFPEQEVDRERPGDDALDREAERAASSLCSELGVLSCGRPERRPAHRHRFTHIDATYVPYRIGVTGRPASPPDAAWVVPGEPTDLALPAAQRRVLDALAGGRSPDDGS